MPYRARSSAEADCLIGKRIAKFREKRGLSQTILGQALGVSFQQIQKYEQGRNRISAANLLLVANVLEVTCDELLKDASNVTTNLTAKLSSYDSLAVELGLVFANITNDALKLNVLSIAKTAVALQNCSKTDQAECVNAEKTMSMIRDIRSLIENSTSH